MSSSGSPLSMSLRLKMITSVPEEKKFFWSARHSHLLHGSGALDFREHTLLTGVPRNLPELSHHFLLIAERRILVDELCLNGELLHIVCDRVPGLSIPGRQWDYHLWSKHKQTLWERSQNSIPPKHASILTLPTMAPHCPGHETQAPQPGTRGSVASTPTQDLASHR